MLTRQKRPRNFQALIAVHKFNTPVCSVFLGGGGGGGRTRNRITFTARSASQPHPHTFLRSARSGCLPFFIGRTCLQSLGSRTFSRAGGWENQEHCSTANVPAPKLCTQHRYTTSKHCWHQHNCTAPHVHVRDGCIANPSRTATPGTTHTHTSLRTSAHCRQVPAEILPAACHTPLPQKRSSKFLIAATWLARWKRQTAVDQK